MVSVNNEWGKLRELFVGTVDNANMPKHGEDLHAINYADKDTIPKEELGRFDGKVYLEDKLTVTRQIKGLEGVVKLIQEAIDSGYTKEEIISTGKFTKEELDAAGLKQPEAPPAAPLPKTTPSNPFQPDGPIGGA